MVSIVLGNCLHETDQIVRCARSPARRNDFDIARRFLLAYTVRLGGQVHRYWREAERLLQWSRHVRDKTLEHEYLLRSGFAQTTLMKRMSITQRLIREDIIDKVLKQDMTANFDVRRLLDLEYTFLYLCMNDGGLLDMANLASNLSVTKVTAQRYIDMFVTSHLGYKLPPFGYGKDVLRGKYKLYLAGPAIAPAVILRDKAMISDAQLLGSVDNFGEIKGVDMPLSIMRIPNPLQCYWMGSTELESVNTKPSS